MTNTALRGKPDAGNPHVRFDEGEVAPAATPRRGSLLYKTKLMSVVAAAAAMFVGTLRADLTRYTEKVDGWIWEYEVAEGKAQYVVGSFTGKYSKPGPDLVIPAKLGGKAVASLGPFALQGYEFTTVTIPSTVTYIGYHAFGYCTNLKSVKLPDSMRSVAYYAFEGCTALQCVDFGKNVSLIGDNVFKGCSSLEALVFRGANEPNNVDDDAFVGVPSSCMVYVPATAKGWPGDDGKWHGMPLVRGDCMVNVNVRILSGDSYGTISGGGVFPVGKKITLKATPNKGCVCGGWQDEETGVYYGHSASISYVVTGADTDFRTRFVQSNVAEDYLYVDSLYEQYDAEDDGTVYVPVGVRSLSEPKVTVKGLPSGVKFDAAKMVLAGKATKPGVYNIKVSATNKSTKDPKTVEFELCVPNFKDELIELDDMYGWCLPGAAYVETIASADGCKVTGLPSGLKWTAKDIVDKNCGNVPANSIYGAPTKPGYYTVFFTKTDGDKVKVKHTATATFLVLPFKKLEIEMVGNTGKDKATGAGEYAVGKKVTLKATADKGKVFGGWYFNSECTDLLDHSASLPFEMPEIGEVKLYAKFVEASADADRSNVQTVLYPTGDPIVLGKEGVLVEPIRCGVNIMWPIRADALSATTVKVSGLPAGLKFTAKEILDSNKDPIVSANSIYGVPTKTGPYKIRITVTTAGKNSFDYDLYCDVTPLERWAVGLFVGFGGPKSFPGPISLTIAENGKISGKYSCSDGSVWTLSAPYFYDYDGENYAYHATVTCKSGKNEWLEDLTVAEPDKPMGDVAATMTGDLGVMSLYQTFWKEDDWKDAGKAIDKAVFEYDEGDSAGNTGSFALTFKADGSVKTKGAFENSAGWSYAATGSSTLVPLEMPNESGSFSAFVNVYFPPNEKKNFGGYFETMYLKWDGKKKEFDFL